MFTVAATKQIDRFPARAVTAIDDALARLALNPRDRAADVRRLKGRTDFSLRVGEYRVIFEWLPPATLLVTKIGTRQNVYKR